MQEVLSVKDIGERYQIERHTASKLVYRLPHFRVGAKLFVRESDLIEWERRRMEYPGKGVREWHRQTGTV